MMMLAVQCARLRLRTLLEIFALLTIAVGALYILWVDFTLPRQFPLFSSQQQQPCGGGQSLANNVAAFPPPPDLEDFCDGENMAYNVSFDGGGDPAIPAYFVKGKKFDCAHLGVLRRYRLTDTINQQLNQHKQWPNIADPAKMANNSPPPPFVLASDYTFYASLRAMIAQIRQRFRPDVQIIVYDLGGLVWHEYSKSELSAVCNLEVRALNYSLLPADVHKIKIFAWKVLIFAEMFAERDAFIYCDTSIAFNTNDYGLFVRDMNKGLLSDFQFTMGTHHGLKFATHPDMFRYIPLDPSLFNNSVSDDIEMMEANMVIVRRTEFTRQLIKWSLLCALTRDCIEPPGARLECGFYDTDQLTVDGRCHRQDQSVMNILLHNMELQLVRAGSKIAPHLRYNHPRNWGNRHALRRGQQTRVEIGREYRCPAADGGNSKRVSSSSP